MNQTKENKRMMSKKLLVSVIAVLTLLVCCAGCAKKTPREALDEAIEKTFSVTPEEELLGLEELNKAVAENTAYTSGVSLTLEDLSGASVEEYASLVEGIGFSVDSATDMKNQKADTSVGISYGGTTYLNLNTQFNASKFYLMVPQLLHGSISVDFDTMLDDMASNELFSEALSMVDTSMLEGFDFWELMEEASALEFTLPEEVTEAGEELDAAIEVVEVKVDEADLPSDISAKKAYVMTIPQDAYEAYLIEVTNAFLAEIEESLQDETFQELGGTYSLPDEEEIKTVMEDIADTIGDLELTFAVTKKGYVSYIATEIEIEEASVEFAATFAGEKSPLEEIVAELSATVDDETVAIDFAQSFDAETKIFTYDIDLNAMDEFSAEIKAEGEYKDIEKGKKYTCDLNYIEFDCSEDISFTLSGSSYLDTTSCEINAPEGTEYELFKMSQDDFMTLIEEVTTNMQNDPLFSEILDLLGVELPE